MSNNLNRFLDAQDRDFDTAFSEISAGRKRSHWMWYIFPQVQGLGLSSTSKFYAITDLVEAADFLKHPVLGERLIRISNELLKLKSSDAFSIFGSPDDMKLKSCMTLFGALEADPVFRKVLDKFFGGAQDAQTLAIINKGRAFVP